MGEGLLGGRLVEWEEACLAQDQQRMEEVDAVPEDQTSRYPAMMSVSADLKQEGAHQSAAAALLGEQATGGAATADENKADDEDDDTGDNPKEADHTPATDRSVVELGRGAALALPGRSAAVREVVWVSRLWATEGGLDFIGEDV